MSYDSDASFDATSTDFSGNFDNSPSAPVPDAAASAALVAETAVAMAAVSQQDAFRADDGWDAPPPPMPTSHAFTSSPAGSFDDDDGPDDWDDRDGSGRRAPRPLSAEARKLADTALRAYTLHPDFCHQSTAEAAHAFGHHLLDGLSANAQVATLRSRWQEVDAAHAAALASGGVLVVAGRAGEGNSGHTAIVFPGDPVMADGRPWPLVCGGGLPMRRSDGSLSAWNTWTAGERAQVRYFTPDRRSWLRRLLASFWS